MDSPRDIAVDYFRQGYNCAQSVFAAFAVPRGIAEDTALRLSCGLGGGMGRLQLTCGAVTGAILAIGLVHGRGADDETNEKRDETYALVRTFDKHFCERCRTTSCRDLLGCDLTTEDGRKKFEKDDLRTNVCEKCVGEAASIVSALL